MLNKYYPNSWARKLTDAKLSGILDWVIVHERRTLFVEVKRPKGSKTEALQIETVKQIRAAGGEAYIVKSADELKTIMAGAKGASNVHTIESNSNDTTKA